MVKLSLLAAAACAISKVDGFGAPSIASRGIQTRFDASSNRHFTTLRSVPLNDDRVAIGRGETPSARKRRRTRNALGSVAKTALSFLVVAGAMTSASPPASAAAKAASEAVEHLHLGQKVANYFQSFGIPDLGVLALISAMPVVELRGAVPVGLWMGLPITTVLPVCVLGNMAPIVPLLFLLRNDKLKELMSPILSRAEKKSASLGVGSIEKQWASLAAFVGIPLPGTGAWTGAMGAFLLGMPTAVALSSIFTGVVSAGVIMSAITLAGKKGGIAALGALAVITGREFLSGKDEDKEEE
ncbi:hypothetical protein ACHAWF_011707 [Thalassiosira exigua]